MIPWFQIEQIHIGPLTIQVWGLLVSIGFVAGSFAAFREAKRKEIKPEVIWDLLVLILLGSLIGARLFHIIEYFGDYVKNPLNAFRIDEGGMAFFGGFFGAFLFSIIYVYGKKLSVLKIADTIAPALAAGYIFGRMGCVMIRDHIGKITDFVFGIQTPEGVIRHEPSSYEVIFNGIMLFAGLWFLRKKIKTDGILSIIFLGWFLTVRFITDFFRSTDLPISDPRYLGLGLTATQIIIIMVFIIGGGVFFMKFKKLFKNWKLKIENSV